MTSIGLHATRSHLGGLGPCQVLPRPERDGWPPWLASAAIRITVGSGTWREITDPSGHYRGITFHGAVQFLPDALLRERLTGQWVGFSRKGDKVNTGLWILEIVSRDTSPDAVAAFSKPGLRDLRLRAEAEALSGFLPQPAPWRPSLLAPGCQWLRAGPGWPATAARGSVGH